MAIDPFAGYKASRDQLFQTLDQKRAEQRQAGIDEVYKRQAGQQFDLGQIKLEQMRRDVADQQALRDLEGRLAAGKMVEVPNPALEGHDYKLGAGPLRPTIEQNVPFSPLEMGQQRAQLRMAQGDLAGAQEAVDVTDRIRGSEMEAKALDFLSAYQTMGPRGAASVLQANGKDPAMMDSIQFDPDGLGYTQDMGEQGILHVRSEGGRLRAEMKGRATEKVQEQWSDPYPAMVGGKEVLLRRNLMTGKTEQVSTGPSGGSGGTMGGLSPEEANQAGVLAKMIVNRQVVPAQIPKRGKVWTAAVTKAYELDPTINPAQFDADFGLSKNPGFRQRGLVAQALPEILTNMVESGKKLDYDDVRFVGLLQKFKNKELNDPDFTKYMAIRNDALMEIASVMRMSGVTDKATELEGEATSPTMSPRALDAWLEGQMASLEPRLTRFEKIISPRPRLKVGSDYQGKKVTRLGWKEVPTAKGKFEARRVAQLDDGSTVEIEP